MQLLRKKFLRIPVGYGQLLVAVRQICARGSNEGFLRQAVSDLGGCTIRADKQTVALLSTVAVRALKAQLFSLLIAWAQSASRLLQAVQSLLYWSSLDKRDQG